MRNFFAIASINVDDPERAEWLRDHFERMDRNEAKRLRYKTLRLKAVVNLLKYLGALATAAIILPYLTGVKWSSLLP